MSSAITSTTVNNETVNIQVEYTIGAVQQRYLQDIQAFADVLNVQGNMSVAGTSDNKLKIAHYIYDNLLLTSGNNLLDTQGNPVTNLSQIISRDTFSNFFLGQINPTTIVVD